MKKTFMGMFAVLAAACLMSVAAIAQPIPATAPMVQASFQEQAKAAESGAIAVVNDVKTIATKVQGDEATFASTGGGSGEPVVGFIAKLTAGPGDDGSGGPVDIRM